MVGLSHSWTLQIEFFLERRKGKREGSSSDIVSDKYLPVRRILYSRNLAKRYTVDHRMKKRTGRDNAQ